MHKDHTHKTHCIYIPTGSDLKKIMSSKTEIPDKDYTVPEIKTGYTMLLLLHVDNK